jgi:hypothetical protein
MDLQSETAKPFFDHPPDFLRVLQSLEAHDEIIGLSNHEGAPPARRLDGFDEPLVQHLVQGDVAQQW